MDANIFKSPADFLNLVNIARNHLKTVRAYPSPDLGPESTARLAFDPYIARKLNSTVPIRVIDVPPVTETWDALDALLDGWEEQRLLSLTPIVSTWEVRLLLPRKLHILKSFPDSGQSARLAAHLAIANTVYPFVDTGIFLVSVSLDLL